MPAEIKLNIFRFSNVYRSILLIDMLTEIILWIIG
jgi:hypothetical protein